MHILLINANPVVSRLLVLCTRDDTVLINEISSVDKIVNDNYDLIFVDEASYDRNVSQLLLKFSDAKKILISYRNDEMKGFDLIIKKPFLPSQITDIIKDTKKVDMTTKETLNKTLRKTLGESLKDLSSIHKEEELSIFPLNENTQEEKAETPSVLNIEEIDQIKSLLEVDDTLDNIEETLSDEEFELRKITLIKEQLIADGLEIVEEDDIVDELSIDLEGTFIQGEKRRKEEKKKKKTKKLKFTEKNLAHIEDAIEMAIASITKKQMKKLLKGKEVKIPIKLKEKP